MLSSEEANKDWDLEARVSPAKIDKVWDEPFVDTALLIDVL